jgi:hypothetical protein
VQFKNGSWMLEVEFHSRIQIPAIQYYIAYSQNGNTGSGILVNGFFGQVQNWNTGSGVLLSHPNTGTALLVSPFRFASLAIPEVQFYNGTPIPVLQFRNPKSPLGIPESQFRNGGRGGDSNK